MKDICGQTVRVGDYVVLARPGADAIAIGRVREIDDVTKSVRCWVAWLTVQDMWQRMPVAERYRYESRQLLVIQAGLVPHEAWRALNVNWEK